MSCRQLLNSMKAMFAIAETEAALATGKCAVIGLLSTGEAKANEAAERENRAGRELDGEVRYDIYVYVYVCT